MGEELAARQEDRRSRKPVCRGYRSGALAGRCLPSVYPGPDLYLPLPPTSARSIRGSRPPTPAAIRSAPTSSIGMTTGSTFTCRDCAAISFRSSIFTPARGRAPSRGTRACWRCLIVAPQRFGPRPALVARTPSGDRITTTYRELRDRACRARLAAPDAGSQARRSRAADRRELARLGARLFRDSQCRRDRSPTRPSDFPRRAGADLRNRRTQRRAWSRPRPRAGSAALSSHWARSRRSTWTNLGRPFILRSGLRAAAPDRKTLASIVFTSGTTGAPKGVMLTHGNFAAEVAMISRVFTLGGDDLLLSLLPLHHTFEFTCGMLLPFASGATVVYPLGVDAANLSRTLADVQADGADRSAGVVAGDSSPDRRRGRSARAVLSCRLRSASRSEPPARQGLSSQRRRRAVSRRRTRRSAAG